LAHGVLQAAKPPQRSEATGHNKAESRSSTTNGSNRCERVAVRPEQGGEAAAKERSDWPSDVQGWPSGQTKAALPPQGRADLRALKRSAAALLRRPQNL